jgi:hypothetical protein
MKREYDFGKARRGPLVPKDPSKTRVAIWLDRNVVDYLQEVVDRAGGGSYEDFINELLRHHILSHGPVRGIKAQFGKAAGRDKLIAALKILENAGAGNLPRSEAGITSSISRSKRKTTSKKQKDARVEARASF